MSGACKEVLMSNIGELLAFSTIIDLDDPDVLNGNEFFLSKVRGLKGNDDKVYRLVGLLQHE